MTADPVEILRAVHTGTMTPTSPVGGLAWEPVDLAPILSGAQTAAPPSVLRVREDVALFYGERLNLVMGESESLKTWLVLVAVLQEVQAGHHVVYLDYEDSAAGLTARLRALGASAEALLGYLSYYDSPMPRVDEIAEALIAERIDAKGSPTLVVIDGNTEAIAKLGLNPDVGVDVAIFYNGIPRYFAQAGAAVVMVDHVTKDREGRGRWAIGSERKISGLTGAAYMVDLVQPFGRERTGRAKLVVSKDRQGFVRQHQGTGRVIATLELRSWPDGGVTYSFAAPEKAPQETGVFRPTSLMAKLSRAIEGRPGLSKNGLRAAVPGKNETKDLALELLVAEGYVGTEPGPRGAVQHVSLKPFKDDVRTDDDGAF